MAGKHVLVKIETKKNSSLYGIDIEIWRIIILHIIWSFCGNVHCVYGSNHSWNDYNNLTIIASLLGWDMVFNATFNNISVLLRRRKPEYPEKTTNMSQVTYKLDQMMCWIGSMVKNAIYFGLKKLWHLK
jgi:hypothetical protein